MTTWRAIEPRVKVLQRRGLVVQSAWRGMGLPRYLKPALEGCDVYPINAKGLSADDTLCVVRLEWLEELLSRRTLPKVSKSDYGRRLDKLEQIPQRSLGTRVFFQDEISSALFRELPGDIHGDVGGYSASDISALATQGWTCVKVVYGDGA